MSGFKVTSLKNMPNVRRACGNCGRLGHLATTCDRAEKAHVKLGIEVEGYWRNDPGPTEETRDTFATARTAADSWHMGGDEDGSLRGQSGYYAYEFKTRPGSLGEAISQLKAVYPHATADCCGMHVHMSFKHLSDISALSTPAFFSFFEARWTAWGTKMEIHRDSQFWARLRGENNYCKRNSQFRIDRDITCHDRYRALNFSSWERHKTVECRLLPMFRDARLGILAVEELVCMVEDYLAALSATLNHEVTLPATAMPVATTEGFVEVSQIPFDLPVIGSEVHVRELDAPRYEPVEPGFVRIPYAHYDAFMSRRTLEADNRLATAMQESA